MDKTSSIYYKSLWKKKKKESILNTFLKLSLKSFPNNSACKNILILRPKRSSRMTQPDFLIVEEKCRLI